MFSLYIHAKVVLNWLHTWTLFLTVFKSNPNLLCKNKSFGQKKFLLKKVFDLKMVFVQNFFDTFQKPLPDILFTTAKLSLYTKQALIRHLPDRHEKS